jgi:hypothetical protein
MIATFVAPTSDPFDRFVAALRARGCRVQPRREGSVRATCPAHDDRDPSLQASKWFGPSGWVVSVRCHAGCQKLAVLRELGLSYRDLYYGARGVRVKRVIDAVYPYLDVNGTVVAEKVRFYPKSFRWRVTDASGKERWDLDGIEPPIYNLPELIEARRVIKVEGERAVDFLRQRGFMATCGSAGASTWRPEWTQSLWECGCEELIVLEDNDPAGKRHARDVAGAVYGFAGATQSGDQGQRPPGTPGRPQRQPRLRRACA